jgi:hypothetical protein
LVTAAVRERQGSERTTHTTASATGLGYSAVSFVMWT